MGPASPRWTDAEGRTDRIIVISSNGADFPEHGEIGHHLGHPNGSSGCHEPLRAAWRVRPLHGLAAARISRKPMFSAFSRRFGGMTNRPISSMVSPSMRSERGASL